MTMEMKMRPFHNPAGCLAGSVLSALAVFSSFSVAQPVNDAFADGTLLVGTAGTASGTNGNATVQPGEPAHADERGGASVWWQWTAAEDGMAAFDTFGSDFDTLLAVYAGDSMETLKSLAADDESGPNGESIVVFEAMAGATYRIAVDGFDRRDGRGPETGTIVLNWRPPLVNDAFGSASVIAGARGIAAGLNEGAGAEPGEPDHAGNTGGASLWWQWTAPESKTMAFDTFGSDFDTLLAVYTGDSLETLTLIAASDDAGPDGESMTVFSAVAGTTYHIAVDGFAVVDGLEPEMGIAVLHWADPLSNDDFAAATVIDGAGGSLTANNNGATVEEGEPSHADEPGGASVWWQWTATENGVVAFDTFGSDFDTLLAAYTGESIESLTFIAGNDDFDDELVSRVIFTAVAGTTYRIAADGYDGEMGKLILHWGPPPVNDAFNGATWLVGPSGETTGRTVGAGRETGEPDHAEEPEGASLWWQWTATADGPVTFDTTGSDFDTILAVYTGDSLAGLTPVASNDDTADNYVSRVSFVAVAGRTYRIAVDGFDGEIGNVILHWGPPQASFTAWIAGFIPDGDNAAPDADPDLDGLPNAAEYILGGNPVSPNPLERPAAAVSDGNLILTFHRDDASESPDVTLTVESGDDLTTWPAVFTVGANTGISSPGVSIAENGPDPDTITVAIPIGADPTKLARVRVTIVP